jgi:UDP-N-acetylmuramoylalanine--D-glutamate ligase
MAISAGERIGVLGLARSGVAASRLALSRGARVYASDVSTGEAAATAAATIRALGGEVELGGHDIEKLASCDRIVLSPGIPPSAAVLRAPELASIPIIAELEFAYEELTGPVIAITGTNGKTTVAALTAHVLRAAGMDAMAGGNIGLALSDLALRDPQPEVTVVEASSFQLGRTHGFAPSIGVLTNLAPDHLDWYPTLRAYYADKARLFANATAESRWVVNGEDGPAMNLLGDAPGERYYFRTDGEPPGGERGGYLDAGGWLTLRLGGDERRIVRAEELRILGPHNVANALAATIAAALVGADLDGRRRGLANLHPDGSPPRAGGSKGTAILWVNDSKATNIASTSVAIRSMDRPTVLLLGGRHKREDYVQLVPVMEGRVRQVVAYGEAAERIEAELGTALPVERVEGDFRTSSRGPESRPPGRCRTALTGVFELRHVRRLRGSWSAVPPDRTGGDRVTTLIRPIAARPRSRVGTAGDPGKEAGPSRRRPPAPTAGIRSTGGSRAPCFCSFCSRSPSVWWSSTAPAR